MNGHPERRLPRFVPANQAEGFAVVFQQTSNSLHEKTEMRLVLGW
jgi:hypothetical protein